MIVQHDLLLQFKVALVRAPRKLHLLLVFVLFFPLASFIILSPFFVLFLLESNVKVATVGLAAVGLAFLGISSVCKLLVLRCLLLLLVVLLFLVELPIAAANALVAGTSLLLVVVPFSGLSVVLVSLLSHRQLN